MIIGMLIGHILDILETLHACGGLARDSNEKFIKGLCNNVGSCNVV